MQRGARQRMYLAFQYHVFLYRYRSIRKIECRDFIEYNGSSVAAFSLENDKIFTNVIDNARQLFSASQQEENRAICFAHKLIPQYLRKFTHHTLTFAYLFISIFIALSHPSRWHGVQKRYYYTK